MMANVLLYNYFFPFAPPPPPFPAVPSAIRLGAPMTTIPPCRTWSSSQTEGVRLVPTARHAASATGMPADKFSNSACSACFVFA
eukprot:1142291-Pelagomonas_calceolata.AAC.2